MKTIYIFIPLLCFIRFAQAQIPNPSFESWSGGNPVGWSTSNTPGDTGVLQSNIAQNGVLAVRLNVVTVGKNGISPYLTTGSALTNNIYFPITAAPVALHGWYIANIAGPGDEMEILSALSQNGDSSGVGKDSIFDSTSVYKEFVVNYSYTGAMAADSATITFYLNNVSIPLNGATYFIIDDLYFGPDSVAGVAQVTGNAVLEQCSPNPAGNIANIIYSIANHSAVNLTLYDVVGRQVKTLMDNREQTPGRYKVPTDVTDLPNGIYFYRLMVNGQSYTQKLVVSK